MHGNKPLRPGLLNNPCFDVGYIEKSLVEFDKGAVLRLSAQIGQAFFRIRDLGEVGGGVLTSFRWGRGA